MNLKNKLLSLGLFLTLLFGLACTTSVANAETVDLDMEKSGLYWQRINLDGEWHSWYLHWYSFNGRVAYCIDPGVAEGTTYTTTDFSVTDLSDSQIEKIMLIAYYGYEYDGHQTTAYRAATQALIWETIGTSRATFSTGRWNTGTIYDFSAEMEEILSLVNNHYVRPSFNGKTIELKVGEEITLTDTNNVLSNFYVSASNGAEVTINGNKLTVKATKVGEITLTFKKTLYTTREYLVYYSNGDQTMMSSGVVDPALFTLTLKSTGGSVEINKYDEDNNSSDASGEATLKGATYGIYEASTDALITTLTTNESGYAKLEHLPDFGEYYIQEISASTGYELDSTKYYFTSSINNIDNSIIVYENVIDRDVEITKVYATDESTIMTPEANVEFGFYDYKDELYTSATTDLNGKLKVNLVYGTYTVKQLTTSSGTTKIDDFKITISESGGTIYYTISNAEITAKLKVVKIDSESGNIIALSGIKFKIFDVTNNEYVCQTVTYPNATTYCEFETDDDGVLITPYALSSGTYILEEVDQEIDGYLWNNETIEFEINENSSFTYDNNYGTLLVIEFANTQVKGEVNITKLGEKLIIEDGTYYYQEILLDGVTYELYAEEDIISGDNTLIYSANELIGTYTTTDGHLTISNLYLGKYYLIETATAENHVIDSTKHSFELSYIDQYTPVVSLDFTFKNYIEKGTLEFTKVDISTGEPLPNTKIQIFDANNDNLIFEGVTDENGKIIIDDLYVGDFYIIETEAPGGYTINENKMYFSITEDGEIVKATMEDEQIVEVPNTSLSDSKIFDIAGLIIIIAGVGYLIYDNKKRK